MEGNNKKKNKNYYKYHNNHSKYYNKNKNHNNKKYYYYKNKKKNKQQYIVNNSNQNINNILLDNVQEKQSNLENQIQEQNVQQNSYEEQSWQNNSYEENIIPKTNIQQVLKEDSSDYEELEFRPIKKSEEDELSTKSGFFKYALGFVLLVVIAFGVSYSFFTYRKEDTRQGDISSGEVYVTLEEQTVNMTLSKLYPRTNEEARSRNDNYVDFTIKAKNTSPTKEVSYTIDITNGADVSGKTRISPQYLIIDLQEKVNNEYTYIKNAVPLSSFSFSDVVPVNTTSEVTREFRLRIWVSDSIIISDTEANASYTQAQFANLYANFSVAINSGDRTYEPTAAQRIGSLSELVEVAGAKRYIGASPNNYVIFNNEQWRIIGVYGDELKIVKSTPSVSDQIYDVDGISNVWVDSGVKSYLYDTYYPTLSNDAKAMIDEQASWNIGGCNTSDTPSEAYSNAQTTTWTGKIGVIAAYEYMYAVDNSGNCLTKDGNNYNLCKSVDWLYSTLVNGIGSWSITPDKVADDTELWVGNSGAVANYFSTDSEYAVSPVVYLKPEVKIVSGNGQPNGNEYILEYDAS